MIIFLKNKLMRLCLVALLVCTGILNAQFTDNVYMEQKQSVGGDGPGAPPDFGGGNPTVSIEQFIPFLLALSVLIIVYVGLYKKYGRKSRNNKISDR